MDAHDARPESGQATPESTPNPQDDLASLPLPELEQRLGSSPDGLTQVEAQQRLAQYGPNEIQEQRANPLLKLLTYFWGPIPWMIEAAVNRPDFPGDPVVWDTARRAVSS
jgi:H+-transporting ATPase